MLLTSFCSISRYRMQMKKQLIQNNMKTIMAMVIGDNGDQGYW